MYAASEAVVGPRDFACVINNIFLSLNFIGQVKKKRNDVTEIISELEIADIIFRRYDRKYVCCSQATYPVDKIIRSLNNRSVVYLESN